MSKQQLDHLSVFAVFFLTLSALWLVVETWLYGYSQSSIVDCVFAVITAWYLSGSFVRWCYRFSDRDGGDPPCVR